MIRLKNLSTKTYKIVMTEHPITKPFQSPTPTGIKLSDELSSLEYDEIKNHPKYSSSEEVILKPGINEFKNDEQAEYFYSVLGQADNGGVIYSGNQAVQIQNNNFILEVDEKGNEIKSNLWKKYRDIKSPLVNRGVDQNQFNIKE